MIIKRLSVWVMVVMGISVMVKGSDLVADSALGMAVIHVGARPVVDAGPIMCVDHANRQIILKEISHTVGQFLANEKVLTTSLVDAKGNKVGLDDFKIGQWVIVRGYQVAKSKIYLESVRAVNGAIPMMQHTVGKLKPINIR